MRASVRKLKNILRRATPGHLTADYRTRLAFNRFVNRVGLVYFGYVNQQDDEHRLIRGITLSPTHSDNHYCIGTYQGYDVMSALRSDTIHPHGADPKSYDWVIMTFDFHAQVDLPRMFIGHHSFNQLFYTHLLSTHPYIQQLYLRHYTQEHDLAFTNDFVVYTRSTSLLEAESILTPEITRGIAAHFKNIMIEVVDHSLYIYVENQHPTTELLESMLRSGHWLADALDERMGTK